MRGVIKANGSTCTTVILNWILSGGARARFAR